MCVLSDSSLFLALFFSGSLCFLFWWVADYLWDVGRDSVPGGGEKFNHGVGNRWPHKWTVRQDSLLSFLFTPLTSGSLPCLEEIHFPFLVLQVIVILFWWCELTCYRCDFMESCHSVTDLQIQPLARRWGDKDEGTDSDVRLHSVLPIWQRLLGMAFSINWLGPLIRINVVCSATGSMMSVWCHTSCV